MSDATFDKFDAKLDAIYSQAKLTNGRVTHVENEVARVKEEVFGKPEHRTDGLIVQVAENTRWREQQQTVVRLVKWAMGSSVVTGLLVIANLVKGLL